MGLVVALLALSFASSAEADRFNDIIVFGFKTGAWGGRQGLFWSFRPMTDAAVGVHGLKRPP